MLPQLAKEKELESLPGQEGGSTSRPHASPFTHTREVLLQPPGSSMGMEGGSFLIGLPRKQLLLHFKSKGASQEGPSQTLSQRFPQSPVKKPSFAQTQPGMRARLGSSSGKLAGAREGETTARHHRDGGPRLVCQYQGMLSAQRGPPPALPCASPSWGSPESEPNGDNPAASTRQAVRC